MGKGAAWGTMASMTSSSPSPANDLHGLLHVVLPELATGPSRNVLIRHMNRLVAEAGPVPEKIVQCWWTIHQAPLSAQQMSGEETALWTALRDQLVGTWDPWREGVGLASPVLLDPSPGLQRLGCPDGTARCAHP